MTDWKPDPRHEKTIGRFTLTPERKGNLTAYRLTTAGDVRILRALPSDQVSAQMRSRIIVGALLALEDLDRMPWEWDACAHDDVHSVFEPHVYLIGTFHLADIPWEWVRPAEPESFADWLAEKLTISGVGVGSPGRLSQELIERMEIAGWEIRRKGTQT